MEKPASFTPAATGDEQAKPPITDPVIPPDKLVRSKAHFKDEYLVILREGVTFAQLVPPGSPPPDSAEQAIRSFVEQFGARLQDEVVLETPPLGFGIRATQQAALRLAADPRVRYVREAGRIVPFTSESPAPWGLDRSDQKTNSLDHSYSFVSEGVEVAAFVVDSGIKVSHCDFRVGPCSAWPVSSRAHRVYPLSYKNGTSTETLAHGTHVAGTLGGTKYGMAKSVQLLALKVLEDDGSTNKLAAALDWIIRNPVKPAVVNISVGGWYEDSTEITFRAAQLVKMGLVVVAAAGNHPPGDSDACHVSPACAPGVIAVAATTETDTRRPNSNMGPCVDLFAPGEKIVSATLEPSDNSANEVLSGTSMAAPHVAGAAARYLQRHPTATPHQVRQYLISQAQQNAPVIDAGTGSPRLLLFVDPLL